GVTVSYFEWIRNLSHMRFGRMERRIQASRSETALSLFGRLTNEEVPAPIKKILEREQDELNLVRSGLEDTMREAYQEIRQLWRERPEVPDLRTAAYVLAIQKIAHYYTHFALN
ncbi:MAG: hypothetical protein MI867_21000, partial [Pseudomonadales bacterium]|nr:hypothetical protein [Pseudomonadales bacterium]